MKAPSSHDAPSSLFHSLDHSYFSQPDFRVEKIKNLSWFFHTQDHKLPCVCLLCLEATVAMLINGQLPISGHKCCLIVVVCFHSVLSTF